MCLCSAAGVCLCVLTELRARQKLWFIQFLPFSLSHLALSGVYMCRNQFHEAEMCTRFWLKLKHFQLTWMHVCVSLCSIICTGKFKSNRLWNTLWFSLENTNGVSTRDVFQMCFQSSVSHLSDEHIHFFTNVKSAQTLCHSQPLVILLHQAASKQNVADLVAILCLSFVFPLCFN